MRSLLKKADEAGIKYSDVEIIDDSTKDIVLNLLSINKVLIKSFNSRSLNEITELLYKLTNSYNNFYSSVRVLTEENEINKKSWLALTKVVYDNNIKLLNIRGIEVPERM